MTSITQGDIISTLQVFEEYHFSKYFLLITEPEPGEVLERSARDLRHTKAHRGAFKVQQVDELF